MWFGLIIVVFLINGQESEVQFTSKTAYLTKAECIEKTAKDVASAVALTPDSVEQVSFVCGQKK